MPAPGDVDVVLAAELMEAGRAIQRGIVTPDRTTLIASTHRTLAVSEKIVPGNGITDPSPVLETARRSAKRFLGADLEKLAVENGSVISASLFGALAAAAVLPFPRESFEATIEAGGRGSAASLKAFAGRLLGDAAGGGRRAWNRGRACPAAALAQIDGPEAALRDWSQLTASIAAIFPKRRGPCSWQDWRRSSTSRTPATAGNTWSG